MDRRARKDDRCKAKASAMIHGTSNQSTNHATTVELYSSKVLGICSGHQGNICGSDGTTQISMGPNL
jgi:hypothetical protein